MKLRRESDCSCNRWRRERTCSLSRLETISLFLVLKCLLLRVSPMTWLRLGFLPLHLTKWYQSEVLCFVILKPRVTVLSRLARSGGVLVLVEICFLVCGSRNSWLVSKHE